MERMTWNSADPALRAELEALLASPSDHFESDYQDAIVPWLILFCLCVVGFSASLWDRLTSYGDEAGLGGYAFFFRYFAENPMGTLNALVLSPSYLGVPVCFILGTWAVSVMVRSYGRRGVALTSDALVLVRGPKLYVYRFAEIVSAQKQTIRTKKQTFDSVTLKLKDGRTKNFFCHARFSKLAMERLPAPVQQAA